MSSFTKTLSTTQVSITPRLWRLDEGFRYYVGKKNSEHYFDVSKGFVYDGGSLPRACWFVDAPLGDGAQAYCLHDILYASHITTRAEADEYLLEALEVLGFGWFRRHIIYRAVRIFGGISWAEKKKEEIKVARYFIHEHTP